MFKKLLVCLLPLVTLVGCNKKDNGTPLYIANLGGDVTIRYFFEADNPEYAPNLQYSFDQNKWEPLSIVQDEYKNIATLSKNQTIYFRGDNPNSFCRYSWSNELGDKAYFRFALANPSNDTKLKIGGNIMSLLSTNDYGNKKDIPCDGCFCNLFRECGYVSDNYEEEETEVDIDASELLLPATELKPYSYYDMFYYSTISKAPLNLPAVNAAKGVYESMFIGCKNLITAPIINLNNLLESSCYQMFYGCYKLDVSKDDNGKVKIFTCPEDINAFNCVHRMFYNTKQGIDDPQPGEVFYYN